ncbi:hypothetical protein O3M35_005107 [Rhynocoris fuscipes]|uniref:Uncharacterized protein n=1 Tax=Rhynocoris fuscipes TaxID=488301 RepID=A0AAW1DJP4_9HEMI
MKERAYLQNAGKIHNYNTRNKTDIGVPSTRLVKTDLSTEIIARKMYNALPQQTRNLEEKQFKKNLRTLLIKKCYYNLDEYLSDKVTVIFLDFRLPGQQHSPLLPIS